MTRAADIATDYPGLPKSVSLLVVEDENRLRELLVDVATDTGFVATAARTAEEALRLMEAEPRQVIVLDLNLPGMNGLELLDLIRQRWPQTQAIIITGFGSLESAQRAIHLDVVEFLTKPCPLSEVEKALHRARRRIDERRQQEKPTAPMPNAVAGTAEGGETLEEHERRLILATLERNGGNRTATAAELGISRRTLHYRLQEYQRRGWIKE
jgi:DNA-binding NtrC family response regulator